MPPLVVRAQGFDRSLWPGLSYLAGRDPQCDIVITDARVSWHHAVLRLEDGRWVLTDNGSTNGTYAGGRRVDRIEVSGECLVRLGDPANGPVLSCTVSRPASSGPPTEAPEPIPPTPAPEPIPIPPPREPSMVRPRPGKTLRIGRAPDNDIVVCDSNVSSYHAELRNVAGGYRVVDMDSLSGTFVNGQRVTAALLSEEDFVGLGDSTFRLIGQQLQKFIDTGVPAEQTQTPQSAEQTQTPEPAAQSRALLVPMILTNAAGKDTAEARVLACRELQAAESPKRTRHLDLSLPPGLGYRVGDRLGICPKNDEERVERLARHLGAALDALFKAPKTMNLRAVPKGVVLQARNVLTNLIDITARPTVPLLDLLLEKVADPTERSRLVRIRDVLQTPDGPGSTLRTAIDAGGYDVLRLLDEFPSCSLNIFEFLRVAQPLRPRYYSTSSSPRIHGDGIAHLTVGLAATPVPVMPERDFRGMSSHYLHTLREGDRLNVFLDSADGFHLQEDVTKPMIFVSAGTGFAPMRAFLWERLARKRAGGSLAEAALFNGIRSSSLDYIYRDEIWRFAAEGVLDHVHVATSREHEHAQRGRRDYVQDRIREQGELVWRLLAADGYVYVCGPQPMRDAVRAAFVDVLMEHALIPREHAEAYLDKLELTERYRPDLWS